MALPNFVYDQIETNAPHVDECSLKQALDDVKCATGEDDAYPVAIVAAAIHEFSSMINRHLIEAYKYMREREYGKQEDK